MYAVVYLLIMLISFVCKTVNSSDPVESLTTARLRKSTSPKPTTLYRRINVERNNYETFSSSTLLDLLRYVEARRKKGRKGSYIWKRDHYCHLQPRQGRCQNMLNRFYYDAQSDKCKPFVYSGCDGNRNNFDSSADCERSCKGAIRTQVQGLKQPAFCFLQPDRGSV